MKVESLLRDATSFDSERKFILKYQFIRLLSASENKKVFHAIDIRTGTEVAIHVSRVGSEECMGTLLLFLCSNRLFPVSYMFKPLGKTVILVTNHLTGTTSLSSWCHFNSHQNREAPISYRGTGSCVAASEEQGMAPQTGLFPERYLKQALTRLIDGVGYLHENCIAHGSIGPDSVTVDPRLSINLGGFEKAIAYDKKDKGHFVQKDMYGIICVIFYMATGRSDFSRNECSAVINQIQDTELREALAYILDGTSDGSAEFATLYRIIRLERRVQKKHNVVFADPIILEHLEKVGFPLEAIYKNVNDRRKKEYYIYRMYELRLISEVYLGTPMLRRDAVQDDYYGFMRRRRYLIEKRRELLERMVEETSEMLQCRYKKQLVLELLCEQEFEKVEHVLYALKARSKYLCKRIGVIVPSYELDLTIEKRTTWGNQRVVFTLNKGNVENFLVFVERFIEEFKMISE